MKTHLLFVCCGLFSNAAFAQSLPQVPTAVQQALASAQPRATHVAWHQCAVGYEAVFDQQLESVRMVGEHKYRGVAQFTPTGKLVETRLDVPLHSLPPLGHTAISQRYPHRQLDRIVRITSATGEITYEAKICDGKDKNGKDRDCQTSRFDENGRPLSI